jgi:geranylgeranyl transferase type-2 subunit beta
VGAEVEDPEQVAGLIRSRRRDDGGFVELGPLRDGGTNPTAAAIGVLRMLDAMDDEIRRRAAEFLVKMQTAEGGLAANTRMPVADLLSTFTGMVALADLAGLAALDLDRVARYLASLEQPQGGFRGGAWDDAADVEYTFYGLGTSALLAAEGG